MHAFILLALAASTAASSIPKYISKLAAKKCDVSRIQQPVTGGATLPAVGAGQTLTLIAIGRGTQNYTCPGTAGAGAAPTAIGAAAVLYNVNCWAAGATAAQLADVTAAAAAQSAGSVLFDAFGAVAGSHYFAANSAPTFDVPSLGGATAFKKAAAVPAPATAANAVAWLALTQAPGQEDKPMLSVYRLETSNGAAPATCGTITGAFQVQYAAEYWFYTAS